MYNGNYVHSPSPNQSHLTMGYTIGEVRIQEVTACPLAIQLGHHEWVKQQIYASRSACPNCPCLRILLLHGSSLATDFWFNFFLCVLFKHLKMNDLVLSVCSLDKTQSD